MRYKLDQTQYTGQPRRRGLKTSSVILQSPYPCLPSLPPFSFLSLPLSGPFPPLFPPPLDSFFLSQSSPPRPFLSRAVQFPRHPFPFPPTSRLKGDLSGGVTEPEPEMLDYFNIEWTLKYPN